MGQISTELWPLIDVKNCFCYLSCTFFTLFSFKLWIRVGMWEWFGIEDYSDVKIIREQSDQGSYCLLP